MGSRCRFRLLTHEVEIEAPPELGEVLAYLANAAEQDVPNRKAVNYSVAVGPEGYEVSEEGDPFGWAPTPDDAVLALDDRMRRRILDYLALGGWLPLHAAHATVRGRRVVILGTLSAPRRALLARLMLEGHPVEAADVVLVRGGHVLPFPIGLRVHEGDVQAVPELGPRLDRLPSLMSPQGRMRAMTPPDVGLAWRIAPGRAAALIVVDDDEGAGDLSLPGALKVPAALRAVLDAQVTGAVPGTVAAREAGMLVTTAPAYRLGRVELPSLMRVLLDLAPS